MLLFHTLTYKYYRIYFFGIFIPMNSTLSNWFDVIKNCTVDNTYKMGWGKSIVECCFEDNAPEDSDGLFDTEEGAECQNVFPDVTGTGDAPGEAAAGAAAMVRKEHTHFFFLIMEKMIFMHLFMHWVIAN